MVFAQGALGVILLGFLLFCLLDVITTDAAQVRHLPKVAWILLVVLINPVGGLAWLFAGRPQAADRAGGLPYKGNRGRPTGRATGFPEYERRPKRPVAPDDDPQFLADLRKRAAEEERMLGSSEEDLRQREEELRRKERGEGDSSA